MNLFLYDKLLIDHSAYRIPMQFLCFARADGKFYKKYREDNPILIQNSSRKYNGNYVYGAVFHVEFFSFYERLIDSYYSCSKSALKRNHPLDRMHRVDTSITPIFFDTLEEFSSLKYKEGEPFDVQTYVGNQTHPHISRSIRKSNKYGLVDKESFGTLWERGQ